MSFVVLSFIFLIFTGTIKSADNPVKADIVVASDGTGDFTTLQAAINAVESNSDRKTIIYIKRGVYDTEKLIIPADKKNISLIGESRDETIISYHIYDCATGKCPAADAALWTGENIATSATLTIYGDGFRAENLTIRNTAGPVGQALAIAVQSDKNIFINCNILGYQDTIYLWADGKRTYFQNCTVVGRTDYIYGAGIAYFFECEIKSWGGGWITAPSTPKDQPYGYVFNKCSLTYATGSPRSGDDGSLIALGRPWHEYPKVTWMNTYFTEMINPLGWPTTWNMAYASTSPDLKLYEYNNYGPGADTSGRADWVGIRALYPSEAENYTIQNVMKGNDNWDPVAEAPLIKTYNWTDSAATNGWLLPDNWSTKTVPSAGEIANVDSGFVVDANGGTFEADLNMTSNTLNISEDDTISYLALKKVRITSADTVLLAGKISTKDTNIFDVSGMLTIEAKIIGVHSFSFINTGKVILNSNSANFDGDWKIRKGTLEAKYESSLGTGNVEVSSEGTFIVSNNKAFHPKSRLKVKSNSLLILNDSIILSEFFINETMQPLGKYSGATNPGLISGSGTITVGRPDVFNFTGEASANWDNPLNFLPQLLPDSGELVICEREMETTGTTFKADLLLTGKGSIRLRGAHKCTGLITMQEGAKISYATSGAGFSLDAPIKVDGDIILQMSSGNVSGSAMTLPGKISGSSKVIPKNIRNMECIATVVLSGDNSAFNGIWDVTSPSVFATSVTAVEGAGKNSFGGGTIMVGPGNKVRLNHEKCAGDTLLLNVSGSGKADLRVNVRVEKFVLNGVVQDTGAYNAGTNPDIFEGTGELTVGRIIPDDTTSSVSSKLEPCPVNYIHSGLEIKGTNSHVSIFTISGVQIVTIKQQQFISLENLDHGIYIVRYIVDGHSGIMKIVK